MLYSSGSRYYFFKINPIFLHKRKLHELLPSESKLNHNIDFPANKRTKLKVYDLVSWSAGQSQWRVQITAR